MGMFLNYQNIANNYTPNNLVKSFQVGRSYTKLDPVKASRPYEEYDSQGNLIGYFWRYGETLNLEFNIDGEITVEDSAIILVAHNQLPPVNKGALGLRAYNIADMKSWTCVNIVDGKFVWAQDAEFIFNSSAQRSVYLSAASYLVDKKVEIKLYNFRHEVIHTQIFDGKTQIIFEITPELSKKLVRGIYYCSLTVFNEEVNMPIFGATDCKLLVK